MENEKEDEELTIIIGDREAPSFEMRTTIRTLSKVIEWMQDLGRPPARAYPVAQMPSFVKEPPIEIETIRSKYRLQEKELRAQTELGIAEIQEKCRLEEFAKQQELRGDQREPTEASASI